VFVLEPLEPSSRPLTHLGGLADADHGDPGDRHAHTDDPDATEPLVEEIRASSAVCSGYSDDRTTATDSCPTAAASR